MFLYYRIFYLKSIFLSKKSPTGWIGFLVLSTQSGMVRQALNALSARSILRTVWVAPLGVYAFFKRTTLLSLMIGEKSKKNYFILSRFLKNVKFDFVDIFDIITSAGLVPFACSPPLGSIGGLPRGGRNRTKTNQLPPPRRAWPTSPVGQASHPPGY